MYFVFLNLCKQAAVKIRTGIIREAVTSERAQLLLFYVQGKHILYRYNYDK